jgi:16S rRNA (cytosine1402-N4)-methyltransferase
MNGHVPVLLKEVLQWLPPADGPGAHYADGTLGGGGHTAAIMEARPGATLTACDVDGSAIERAQLRFATEIGTGRLHLHHGAFSTLPEVGEGYDAILADLGYSSIQLSDASYGLSFQTEGPLDMRLKRPSHGPTAWDIVHGAPVTTLASIFRDYGEVDGANRMAARIQEAARRGEITDSTASLAGWVEKNAGGGHSHGARRIHPATKIFQALRIAVNDEMRELDRFLKTAILKLKPRGRLLVITFHSLEDRMVKRLKDAPGVRALTKKALEPTDAEIEGNPRSRSAKLRVLERTS